RASTRPPGPRQSLLAGGGGPCVPARWLRFGGTRTPAATSVVPERPSTHLRNLPGTSGPPLAAAARSSARLGEILAVSRTTCGASPAGRPRIRAAARETG